MRANFVIKAIRVIHYDIIEHKNSNKLFKGALLPFQNYFSFYFAFWTKRPV